MHNMKKIEKSIILVTVKNITVSSTANKFLMERIGELFVNFNSHFTTATMVFRSWEDWKFYRYWIGNKYLSITNWKKWKKCMGSQLQTQSTLLYQLRKLLLAKACWPMLLVRKVCYFQYKYATIQNIDYAWKFWNIFSNILKQYVQFPHA